MFSTKPDMHLRHLLPEGLRMQPEQSLTQVPAMSRQVGRHAAQVCWSAYALQKSTLGIVQPPGRVGLQPSWQAEQTEAVLAHSRQPEQQFWAYERQWMRARTSHRGSMSEQLQGIMHIIGTRKKIEHSLSVQIAWRVQQLDGMRDHQPDCSSVSDWARQKSMRAFLQFSSTSNMWPHSWTCLLRMSPSSMWSVLSASLSLAWSQLARRRSALCMRAAFLGFILQFQWFLMELSGRPGRKREMVDHLLPKAITPNVSSHSSLPVHSYFITPSRRWLCHLSRHCFPPRPTKLRAMVDQSLAPLPATVALSSLSSSLVHTLFFPLTNSSDLESLLSE